MDHNNTNIIEEKDILRCICGRSTDGLCHCCTTCHTNIYNESNDIPQDDDYEFNLEEYD